MWQHIADPQRDQFERLVQKARDLLAEGVSPSGDRGRTQLSERLASSEARLHEALALSPFDFPTLFLLAEVQSLRGHASDAVATLERAEPRRACRRRRRRAGFASASSARTWVSYREALASYEQPIALGDAEAPPTRTPPSCSWRSAACARPRTGIARPSASTRAPPTGAARARARVRYYGLAVALDRDRQADAARETMARALAMDPSGVAVAAGRAARRRLLFFPEGDVFYYIGLASEVGGKTDERTAAFQEFVARQPKRPWLARARAHLGALPRRSSRRRRRRPSPPAPPPLARVATATVSRRAPSPRRWSTPRSRAPAAVGRMLRRGRAVARSRHRSASSSRSSSTRGAPSPRGRHLPAPFDAAPPAAVEAALRASLQSRRPRTRSPPARASSCY